MVLIDKVESLDLVEAKRRFFQKLLDKYKSAEAIPAEEWKPILSEDEFYVARLSGTEPAHSGSLTKNFKEGAYTCICCGSDLFVSSYKYSCAHGWPSFSESVGKDLNVERRPDTSFGLNRTEVRCKTCLAHLGHVFNDPHSTSNERYCINSCSVDFQETQKQSLE
ncbi:Methionine-R-sulfoxide reductase B2, mitochondrial [Aphelenchoides besseyi]|nr:Methionine-R-sulfoxide reductase B2, mitochondrial [Aphelenchoides besseyi]KAI6208789.1 Methionine-R-sulfoxide reductase B2, mitochondrial [Aphelenchoides besseyi]